MLTSVDTGSGKTHLRHSASEREELVGTCLRGGHYGQRPTVPHKQVEHMAAPTEVHDIKKSLANGEPSTHGAWQTLASRRPLSRKAVLRRLWAESGFSRHLPLWLLK